MDFYEDIVQPGVGFCLFCVAVGGAIKACSNSDEPTRTSPSPEPVVVTPEPSPDPSPPYSDYIDCRFCDGSGKCPQCDGKCGFYVDDLLFNCGVCGGIGVCPSCQGSGRQSNPNPYY